MAAQENLAFIDFAGPAEWELWLANHHEQEGEAWLRIAKKDAGVTSVTITEALDVALCYGWIDSHRKGFDGSCYLQRYSPRRAKSPWSLVNVRKAEKLMEKGLMQPAGYKEIELAKADGRWDAAYESQKSAVVPPDLEAALERHEQAKRAFIELDRTAQYNMFLPLLKATTEKSRAAQLQKAIAKLEAVRS
ncbi:YdeI family protein [Paenibacillus sp. NEAU-GSW1]|uniref:YdeI/OmpD-associated family protein n=1 Tax=Paenibacillus sp. NEAU-GSW1 TaxID=2682486 RepID=UPI0020A62255|nr:YdeI/OmpD-associated family protein [Paenibacillus sp. NEAU-GSW1]